VSPARADPATVIPNFVLLFTAIIVPLSQRENLTWAAIDLAPRRITRVLVNPGWVRTDMGGPKAPLSLQESVTAMRRLIETFGPNQSGKF
jgi:hypothetical protein